MKNFSFLNSEVPLGYDRLQGQGFKKKNNCNSYKNLYSCPGDLLGNSNTPDFGKRGLQARIYTGFHCFTEIGNIFHNKLILTMKNTF